MASTSLMFGSLAHFYEKPVVVLATSCAGALAVLYGNINQLHWKHICFSAPKKIYPVAVRFFFLRKYVYQTCPSECAPKKMMLN